jgi:hypothetical protein
MNTFALFVAMLAPAIFVAAALARHRGAHEPRVDEGAPLSQATRLRRCVGRLRSGCLPGSRIA